MYLRREGVALKRRADGYDVFAAWTGNPTIEEIVAEADHYLVEGGAG